MRVVSVSRIIKDGCLEKQRMGLRLECLCEKNG